MSLKLNVITVSTRPGRVGPSVARWFCDFATAHGGFVVQPVDLADFKLPVYDEPEHPMLQKYQHAHTRQWAESVASADAYAFVLPEYNYNPPPAFYNALNYVYREWNYKPAGLVSYGGVSGGLRSAQTAKQLLTTLKVVPMTEGVAVPMVARLLDENRNFPSNELIDKSATTLLDEMVKWAKALKTMRS
ncbi:MAG: NAD(P)H-dependent oxidoreductase [Burkholderiaceae bacterium]